MVGTWTARVPNLGDAVDHYYPDRTVVAVTRRGGSEQGQWMVKNGEITTSTPSSTNTFTLKTVSADHVRYHYGDQFLDLHRYSSSPSASSQGALASVAARYREEDARAAREAGQMLGVVATLLDAALRSGGGGSGGGNCSSCRGSGKVWVGAGHNGYFTSCYPCGGDGVR